MDKTISIRESVYSGSLSVTYSPQGQETTTTIFSEDFTIGREEPCRILLPDKSVSKQHVELCRDEKGWWIKDLDSQNGTFLNGERIQHALITKNSILQLAPNGPILRLGIRRAANPSPSAEQEENSHAESVTQIVAKYGGNGSGEDDGDRTLMMREAFSRVKKVQSKKYGKVIFFVMALLVLASGVATHQYLQVQRLTQIGADIFYQMKDLEVEVAKLHLAASETGDGSQLEHLAVSQKQLAEMQERYASYVEETGIFSKYESEEDRLIFKVARIFGECDLLVPEKFLLEVKRYIKLWKTSQRLKKAIAKTKKNGYAPIIFSSMVENDLPPQFLYIALQESSFKPKAIGPKTRYGIAKGFWQFIPSTAAEYGLKTGPLVELRKYDPRDERFDFTKSTATAADYLKYIYSTEAQASGLLVVASYNWGHNAVRRRIRKMPDNPNGRNFWKLLESYEIPKETYNYVFLVFSAAVIGENPKLFGFDFENPFKELEKPDQST
ncbi:MAG: FHA domain-containing protein [Gammaproteobacteria bacterium]|nr:FHA domain-containing protein [Gammaproteobacteria bacterium]